MQSKTDVKISIVTVNFHGIRETCELLNSIRKLNDSRLDVIVVDNGSEPDEASSLQIEFPEVKVIRSEKNLGFAGGNNLALPFTKGEYIYFVNNDTEIPEGSIDTLIDALKQSPNGGIVSPRIIFYHSPETLQYAGFSKMNPVTLRTYAIGNREKDSGQFSTGNTYSIHGAAMMIDRHCLEQVGPMWDGYFLYAEEFDWSLRIREAGFSVLVEPKACIYHKESMSTGKNSPLKTYFLNRNRMWFARRNFKWRYKVMSMLYILMISVPVNLIRSRRNSTEHFKAYLKGIREGIGKMPA